MGADEQGIREPDKLADPDDRDERSLRDLDAEMVRYYAARAGEYDDWYMRRGRYSHGLGHDGAWRADLEAAAAWRDRLPYQGQIGELAAGTGWWSPILVAKGSLSLYDAAPEPLEHARARLAQAGQCAGFAVRDAWAEPDRQVDGLFTGFWLSHVGRDRLEEFFALVARWLAPGGLFAFVDSRQDPESGALDHRLPEADVQVRRLADGSSFRVRKVYYEPDELLAALARSGFVKARVETTSRFFVLGSARRGRG